MAQSGLHIPAESESKVGVFSARFCGYWRRAKRGTIFKHFSGHMANIVEIMRQANDKSLVAPLMNLEPVPSPSEGDRLAMADLVGTFRTGSCGVATTHYGTLKTFAYNTPE